MGIDRRFIAVFLLLGILLPQPAMGEEKPLWELGLGAGILYMPDYRGSDESRFYLLPYPYIVYRGGILKIDEQRISGQIFKTDRLLLTVSAFGAVPVKSSKNAARAGMPDLDPTFELGPALKVRITGSNKDNYKLSLNLPVRAFFSTDFSSVHHKGWVFSPRLNFEMRDIIGGTGINFGASAGPLFADSSYTAYFYEVEPSYATASRSIYSAGGGYSGSTLTIGLHKNYKQLIFNIFISADFLHDSVFEDSPLVKSRTSVMSGFNISWVFLRSTQAAAVDD